jgi:two-component system LytT family response regulator
MIKSVIIDDEKKSCDVLKKILYNYCTGIEVIGLAHSANDGARLIETLNPDVVFLDIEMPDGDGFHFLHLIADIKFKTIFITAFEQYAIRAIKHEAFDYLLKPLSIEQVRSAVEKLHATINKADNNNADHNSTNKAKRNKTNGFHKLAIHTLTGIEFIDINDILWMMASDSYTILYLRDKRQIISSQNLGKYEDLLCHEHPFIRIHHSTIVNLNHIHRITKGKHMTVVMQDGKTLDVSVRKKEALIALIEG